MIYASELSDPSWAGDMARATQGDRGDWRVVLHPAPETKALGRSGLFIHGGGLAGSAGCIDIGGGMFGDDETKKVLNAIKSDADGIIDLQVVR